MYEISIYIFPDSPYFDANFKRNRTGSGGIPRLEVHWFLFVFVWPQEDSLVYITYTSYCVMCFFFLQLIVCFVFRQSSYLMMSFYNNTNKQMTVPFSVCLAPQCTTSLDYEPLHFLLSMCCLMIRHYNCVQPSFSFLLFLSLCSYWTWVLPGKEKRRATSFLSSFFGP